MTYGTLEDTSEYNRPMLSSQELPGRSVDNQFRSSQGLLPEHGRRGVSRLASARGSVLRELLVKPHHRDDEDETMPQENSLLGELDNNAQNRLPKSFIYTMLNPRSNTWQAVAYKWFITIVIISDLVSFVISTEPELSAHEQHLCHVWEGVTSTIFLAEYVTRLLVVSEAKKYRDLGWFWGRLQYLATYSALLDFAATIPFFLELSTGWDLPTLTYLRAFRLLRILKTSGFAEATNAVYRVMYYNRQILYVALLIGIGLVIITAVLMYYLRPRGEDHSQGKRIDSHALLSCDIAFFSTILLFHIKKTLNRLGPRCIYQR
jgi:hypothetical protein